jgi:AraC-like DNA-binding protein
MRTVFEGGIAAFGALSQHMRDNLYWFGLRGFIFTSPWVVTPSTVRHAAVLLLTAPGKTVEVRAGAARVEHDVVAIASQTRRGLRATDAGLVSVHVFPPHPCFSAFQRIGAQGLQALQRSGFGDIDAALADAYAGRLDLRDAEQLFERIVHAATEQLPRAHAGMPTVAGLHELLLRNPGCSLRELADELGLSYAGTSRHFSRTVGLPLRSNRLWLMYYPAADLHMRGVTCTEAAHAAGFTDSSHLVKTWQASYGFSPSYTSDRRHVRIFSRAATPAGVGSGGVMGSRSGALLAVPGGV